MARQGRFDAARRSADRGHVLLFARSWRLARAARAAGRAALLCGLVCWLGSSRLEAFGWPNEVVEVGRGLSSEQSSDRLRAAVRLLTLPANSARPLVERALEDEDDAVRLAAARAAVNHGYEGLGEQVVGWLKDPAPTVRAAALRVLGIDVDVRHVPSMARAALDPDETVRASAVRSLGRAPLALAPEVMAPLVAALDDTSAVVRAEAVVGLGRLGDASTLAPLVARMTDGEEGVRRAAAVALGAVGDRKATVVLSFALEDRSVGVAAAAARSLGDLGDPSAQVALERALLEPGWGPLQMAAAQSLAALDQRRGWDAILVRLAEQDVAPALHGLFANLSIPAQESLANCLQHSGGLALLECARLVARAGMPLDELLDRVRRGGLPTVKLFQSVPRTSDVELLVLAIERLVGGSAAERHAALELLDRSAPLPAETAGLVGEALRVPGLGSKDVARLLLLLSPGDADPETLVQLTRASDPLVAASARALSWMNGSGDVLGPFDASTIDASVYGQMLSRGMSRSLAERLLTALALRAAPLSAANLTALQGLPPDLSAASVQQLARLASAEQGGERDFLLSLLVEQKAAGPLLEGLFARGSVQDRRSLTGFLLHGPTVTGVGRVALSESDPWVQAQAAQRAVASDVERLLTLARSNAPSFVRSSALFGLARVAPEQAAETLHPCELLRAPELGVRVGAVRLIDRASVSCPERPLEDIVLLEREPILRELAARALRRRDPSHRALRSCRAYDVEAQVALACSASNAALGGQPTLAQSELGFVEVIPPWLDQPAPTCPYALLDAAGDVFIGVTDRRGQAKVPGRVSSRLLDPRVAL